MKSISKMLLFCLFAISSIQAMEQLSSGKLTQIKKSSLFATHDVGEVDLFHNDKGFHVVQDDEVHLVNSLSIDPVLRTLKYKQLKKFQKIGYIQVKKNDHNEFSLVSKVRGNGGGPATGVAAYWTTRAVGYAGFVSAIWFTGGEVLLHTLEIQQAIEASAMAAAFVGTALPTP